MLKPAALVSYKAVSDALGKAATFAILMLAARRLPAGGFGLFSLASALGWMLAIGTDFGLQLHFAREVSNAPDRLRSILQPLFRVRLALALGGVGLTALAAFALLPLSAAAAFVLLAAAYVASALVEFLNYGYRAIGRSDLESTLTLVQRLGALAAAAVVLGLAPRLDLLALAVFAPPALVFAWSLRIVKRLAPTHAEARGSVHPFSRTTFVREVLPIGAGILLSALYLRIDLFLLEHWRGLSEVGQYNAVFRVIEALRLAPGAILAVLLPAFFRRRDSAFVWRTSVGLTSLGVALAAPTYVAAPVVIGLAFGEPFLPAVPVFRVLLLAFPLMSLNYGLTHLVIGWNGARAFAVICAITLAANLAMNVALIPSLGMPGAAWATVGTEVVLMIAAAVRLAQVGRLRAAQPASG